MDSRREEAGSRQPAHLGRGSRVPGIGSRESAVGSREAGPTPGAGFEPGSPPESLSPTPPVGQRWRDRPWFGAALVALGIVALLVPLVLPVTYVLLATIILILALLGASVNLLLGTAGLVPFGQALYFGVAAYATALAIQRGSWPHALAFALGPVAAALVALGVGALAVRRSGVFFSMLTLAAAQIGFTIAIQFRALTGGEDGIINMSLPGFTEPAAFYYLTLGLVVLSGTVLFVIDRSAFGYTLRAIREHRRRAELNGVPFRHCQLVAFVISGFFAGVAGTLFMFFNRGAFPAFLFWTKSVDPLVVTVLGGVGHFFGPIVGAIAYGLLTHFTAAAGEHAQLALGIALLLIVLVFPRGLPAVVTEARALRAKFRVPSSKSQVHSSGIQNVEPETPNSARGTRHSESATRNQESKP